MSAQSTIPKPAPSHQRIRAQLWQVLKSVCWNLVDGLVELLPVELAPVETKPGRVLVVKADAIGDFVMWFQEGRRLILHLQKDGSEVVLVAGSAWARWAADMGIADQVVSFDRALFDRNLRYRFKLGRQIRSLGCARTIQPTYSRISHSGDAIARVSGAATRIGSTGDPGSDLPWRRARADRWFTTLIPALTEETWEPDQNVHFLRQYLGEDYVPGQLALKSVDPLEPPPGFFEEIGDRPFYVLFPGASEPGKRWPVDRLAEIAERLYTMTGWQGIVCGAPEDEVLARDLTSRGKAPISNWVGRTGLSELSGILSRSQLLISNDTSASHIAAAVDLPSVCVLGGGHFGRFHPYPRSVGTNKSAPLAVFHPMDCFQCSWRCVYTVPDSAPKPCISEITVEQVWNAVLDIVMQSSAHAPVGAPNLIMPESI